MFTTPNNNGDQSTEKTIYSFRAECMHDVESFVGACKTQGIGVFSVTVILDDNFPDVEVQLHSTGQLEELRDVMRSIVDGHVMVQTLRQCPLSENSLERDYDL